ncbi:pilus assembly protein PilZ [Pseudomonas sp. R5(2019)]|uniref:pilus assembly protein PilZ n=1 Tax=Pseudomonas sp. R5(2019) TaxID=2697566 RepID=UPI003531AE8A
MLLTTLAAWLGAQCVLALWHGPAPLPAAPPVSPPVPDLLARHWSAKAVSDVLPLTTLAVEVVGGLKATPISATVVVLRFEKQQRALRRGQRLAPGIVLEAIAPDGLIFDHKGRRERLPWPQQRPLSGLKRQG